MAFKSMSQKHEMLCITKVSVFDFHDKVYKKIDLSTIYFNILKKNNFSLVYLMNKLTDKNYNDSLINKSIQCKDTPITTLANRNNLNER